MVSSIQRSVDNFYLSNAKKPCCAGCDWWRFHNSLIGECTKHAPVSGSERWSMIGFTGISCDIASGHIMTKRDHYCGDFIDTYEWE